MRILFAFLIVWLALGVTPAAMAEQDDPRLEVLFEQLLADSYTGEVRTAEQAIWKIWMETPDPVIQRALNVGSQAMQMGAFDSAMTNFNMVIEFHDQFAEGWNKRATLYYLMGDYEASIRDIDQTLAREPRHFGALSGLGLVYLKLENDAKALDAFERALAVHPHLQTPQYYVRKLSEKLKGIRT